MNFDSVLDKISEIYENVNNTLIQAYKEDYEKGRKQLIKLVGKKAALKIEPYILQKAGVKAPKREVPEKDSPQKYNRMELAEIVFNLHQKGAKYSEICDQLNFDRESSYEHIRYLNKWYQATVLNPKKPTINQDTKPKEDPKDKGNILSSLIKRLFRPFKRQSD